VLARKPGWAVMAGGIKNPWSKIGLQWHLTVMGLSLF
jgi:hypothetical protein